MFSTIFKQELKYWFKRPAFYIYAGIFLLISCFLCSCFCWYFRFSYSNYRFFLVVNSPIGLSSLFNGLTTFIFFLFPSIIGVSIYRDYKSEMHTILYSYPFTKANYLFAKFFSAINSCYFIVLVIALGMFIGFRLPGTNPEYCRVF